MENDDTRLAPTNGQAITHETASSAVAAQARASVEARYIVASRNPRNWDQVRALMLKECTRSSFAHAAIYRKPIGQGIEGPSIRFAEAAARIMGNIFTESPAIYDDDEKRIVRVSTTDLESNTAYSRDIVIEKVVERRTPREGQTVISRRVNSVGETTCLVRAGDDELLNKQEALISKAMRNNILRLFPGDLLDECLFVCRETQKQKDLQDPDAARNKVFDSFALIGVLPAEIAKYLGHDVAASSPAELAELRALYAAIRDGEATWGDALEGREVARKSKPTGAPPKSAADLTQKLKEHRTKRDLTPEEREAAEAEKHLGGKP